MMDIAEYWLEDFISAGSAAHPLQCPRCGCMQFTVQGMPYGVELACWKCPTYVGIRLPAGGCVGPSSPESEERSHGNENVDRAAAQLSHDADR